MQLICAPEVYLLFRWPLFLPSAGPLASPPRCNSGPVMRFLLFIVVIYSLTVSIYRVRLSCYQLTTGAEITFDNGQRAETSMSHTHTYTVLPLLSIWFTLAFKGKKLHHVVCVSLAVSYPPLISYRTDITVTSGCGRLIKSVPGCVIQIHHRLSTSDIVVPCGRDWPISSVQCTG